MRVSASVAVFLLVAGCQSESTGQSAAQPATDTATISNNAASEPAAAAKAESSPGESTPAPATESAAAAAVDVTFLAGDSDSPLAPRYSPKGKGLPLKAATVAPDLGFDGLETEVVLGTPTNEQAPFRMLITRAAADQAYTRLFVDTDRNGQFNEEPVIIETTESRGNFAATTIRPRASTCGRSENSSGSVNPPSSWNWTVSRDAPVGSRRSIPA